MKNEWVNEWLTYVYHLYAVIICVIFIVFLSIALNCDCNDVIVLLIVYMLLFLTILFHCFVHNLLSCTTTLLCIILLNIGCCSDVPIPIIIVCGMWMNQGAIRWESKQLKTIQYMQHFLQTVRMGQKKEEQVIDRRKQSKNNKHIKYTM